MGDEQNDDRPDAALMAELLQERHAIDSEHVVAVAFDVAEQGPQAAVTITRSAPTRDSFKLVVTHLDGGESDWVALTNATDALIGMLVESGFAHRDLPTGEGLEHGGALFRVRIERTRPDIDQQADALLNTPDGGD